MRGVTSLWCRGKQADPGPLCAPRCYCRLLLFSVPCVVLCVPCSMQVSHVAYGQGHALACTDKVMNWNLQQIESLSLTESENYNWLKLWLQEGKNNPPLLAQHYTAPCHADSCFIRLMFCPTHVLSDSCFIPNPSHSTHPYLFHSIASLPVCTHVLAVHTLRTLPVDPFLFLPVCSSSRGVSGQLTEKLRQLG